MLNLEVYFWFRLMIYISTFTLGFEGKHSGDPCLAEVSGGQRSCDLARNVETEFRTEAFYTNQCKKMINEVENRDYWSTFYYFSLEFHV